MNRPRIHPPLSIWDVQVWNVYWAEVERRIGLVFAHSAGVARQYSGTAGRLRTAKRVFLAYASGQGQTLLDRELYLPKEWAEDPERCRHSGAPDALAHVRCGRGAGLGHRW